MTTGRLEGKVAIITGAAGGIGFATTRRFVDEGASVVLVDKDADALAHAASELPKDQVLAVTADVADKDDVARYVDAATERFGGVDIVFLNAGVEGRVANIDEATLASFSKVWQVNVLGTFLGLQAATPILRERGGGSIVITSSVAGLVGVPGLAPYVASKHAVIGLAKTAALELASDGIRVNTINPGPVDNRFMRSIENQVAPGNGSQARQGFERRVPLGRYTRNDEVAAMAAFLASDESRSVTGASYVIDGGMAAAE